MAQGMIMRRGGAAASGLPEFTYTGTCSLLDDGDKNWRIKFLTSGTLIFQNLKSAYITIFCVGGGASGGTRYSSSAYNGGGGGGAGYAIKYGPVLVEEGASYSVVIGAGGTAVSGDGKSGNDGGKSYFGSDSTYYANGGIKGHHGDVMPLGGNGGSGGGSGHSSSGFAGGTDGSDGAGSYPGQGQGTTTKEFGDATGTLYATGGAGGSRSTTSPAGTANTGDGGGGGGTNSAAGGSGIVIIRNARAA